MVIGIESFVVKTLFSLLDCLYPLVKYQLTIFVKVLLDYMMREKTNFFLDIIKHIVIKSD